MQSIKIKTYIENIIRKNNYEQLSRLQYYIPKKALERYQIEKKGEIRNRIFSLETTLLGMMIQAGQEDKSKQNVVMILSKLHNERMRVINRDRKTLMTEKEQELEKLNSEGIKKPGRPRKRFLVIQKSKEKEISTYPSSYDEATIRFSPELVKDIFEETAQWYKIEEGSQNVNKWKGKNVYIVDGTDFKTQDTAELREYFDCDNKKTNQRLPIGRLEGIINLYGGGLVAVEIDKYTSSEGRMLKKFINKIPEGTIVLGDDLYSRYGYFSYFRSRNIDLITQNKINKKEEIIRVINEQDRIVKWTRGKNRQSVLYEKAEEMQDTLTLRRIDIIDPQNPEDIITLYTTLLDENRYSAIDIIALFFKRWEIEISFRQIKSILKMEYLRGKSSSMVLKEIYAHLILYNIIRKMLNEETPTTGGYFSPYGKEIQAYPSMVKGPYVDKLGRSFSGWNAGRHKKIVKQKQN